MNKKVIKEFYMKYLDNYLYKLVSKYYNKNTRLRKQCNYKVLQFPRPNNNIKLSTELMSARKDLQIC